MDAIESQDQITVKTTRVKGTRQAPTFRGSGRLESSLFEDRFKCRLRDFECLGNRANIKKASRKCYGGSLS